jgi:hypothetical protein
MIRAFLDMVLGPGGKAVLDFYFANQLIINAIFLVWAVIMTYASFQMSKIRSQAVLLSVDMLAKYPDLSNEQIWEIYRPVWQEEVQKIDARLIPNLINLWVTKPTPEKIITILRLGPDWFEAIRNGEVLAKRYHRGKNDKLSSMMK